MDRRPYRLGCLALGTAALLAAAGCIGPNPAFLGVDALPRPDSGGGREVGDADAPPSSDAAPADGPPAVDASPPDAAGIDTPGMNAGMDAAPPADTGTPDVMAPPPDTVLPVDLPADLPAVDAPRAPTARYNVEASLQSWGDLRPGREFPTTTSRVTAPAPAWDGQWSMAVAMRSGAGTENDSTHRIIGIAQEFRTQLPANTTISFRVWLPAGDALEYLQPFVLYYKPADRDGAPQWGGIDPPLFAADLARGQWITITHRVPSNADARGVVEVGLEFVLRPSRSLTAYLDGVHW